MAGFNHTPTPMVQPKAQDQHVDTRLMDVADQGHGGPGFPQGPNPPGVSNRQSQAGPQQSLTFTQMSPPPLPYLPQGSPGMPYSPPSASPAPS
ncbi:hypothetical protein PtA15_6A641 [Puccinia triticina]|uniref:Uncharacterized protein n=1 Tax=Puccinia triticina TaxID=208348 RepID=A0ABY7CLA2_9BASI|nr:uncharacterized protein PtA15_6A641 [Puccinia triticina]WAQ86011.1 hypothetical protein PtA15_6A641 [Puccinia triticina]